jgi:hypothetical protein
MPFDYAAMAVYFLEQDALPGHLEGFLNSIADGKEQPLTTAELQMLQSVFQKYEQAIHRIAVLDGIYQKRSTTGLFEFVEVEPAPKKASFKERSKKKTVDIVLSESAMESFQDKMSLFQILDPRDQNLSHTIEMLVGAPRFFRGATTTKPKNTTEDLIVRRRYRDRGSEFEIITHPVVLKTEKTTKGITTEEERHFYPGSDVELIEDILIRIGTKGQGELKADSKGNSIFGVFFTIRQIRKELEAFGRTKSHAQILHILELGSKCVQEMIIPTADNRKLKIVSPIFKGFIHVDRATFEDADGENKQCYVELHPLIVPCIKSNTFRKYNFISSMKYVRQMAVWLHKRLSHYFVQAGAEQPFSINLTTVLTLYGANEYDRISDNHKEFIRALEEMIEKGDLKRYEYDIIKDKVDKRKTKDYFYRLWVSDNFVSDMIRFNIDFEQRNPARLRKIPDQLLDGIKSS